MYLASLYAKARDLRLDASLTLRWKWLKKLIMLSQEIKYDNSKLGLSSQTLRIERAHSTASGGFGFNASRCQERKLLRFQESQNSLKIK